MDNQEIKIVKRNKEGVVGSKQKEEKKKGGRLEKVE